MKIGIDIDDTTFLTIKSMLKYADKYQEEITGKARKNKRKDQKTWKTHL